MKKFWQRRSLISVLLVLLLVGNLIWSIYNVQNRPKKVESYANYPLLSKRIFVEDQNDVLINFVNLRTQLQDYLKVPDKTVGLYFEYLPSGTSIGINANDEIRLLSLAKVPTVMAAYKLISQGQLNEKEELTITAQAIDSQYGSLWKKGAGTKVSVEEAARLAIVDSDNTAHNLLIARVPIQDINKVYESLDIPYDTQGGYPAISPKNYSSVLRTLYLSAYLPKEYSNKILRVMTQTIYKDKIPALLPGDVKVAHKVGVYTQGTATPAFSDCGIIYVPKRPYLLCMTYHGSEADAQKYMSQSSKLIYDYVSAAKQ